MRTQLTDMVGCEYPIVAFSHCRDVIAAVTNAGGFGMFGASGYDADELDVELKWIDDHTGGRGYGIDVLIPIKYQAGDVAGGLPEEHRAFIDELMARYGVPELPEDQREGAAAAQRRAGTLLSRAAELWDVGSAHSVRMYASALGPPPARLIDQAHEQGAVVGALVGAVAHAERQKAAGRRFRRRARA